MKLIKREETMRILLNSEKGDKPKIYLEELLNKEKLKEIYTEWNSGESKEIPTSCGKFDIKLNGGYIEVDEELHFNKYRLITLNSKIYKNSKILNLENYKKFCTEYEEKCLKAGNYGKKWKNDSTEKQFGKSNKDGNLDKNGSSRWKQRAFYDLIKDIYCITNKFMLKRIAIW
jgi:hypothetical protein